MTSVTADNLRLQQIHIIAMERRKSRTAGARAALSLLSAAACFALLCLINGFIRRADSDKVDWSGHRLHATHANLPPFRQRRMSTV